MHTVVCLLMLTVAITISPTMVLSEYAKIRILTLWRDGLGPTRIAELLKQYEGIETTRKSVSLFLGRYTVYM